MEPSLRTSKVIKIASKGRTIEEKKGAYASKAEGRREQGDESHRPRGWKRRGGRHRCLPRTIEAGQGRVGFRTLM
ncbi:hypothetical protein B296_00051409 [Ensete ventricosum]|uniref:Uncharacterized protein n=1 Tax=Ensete ventricosum TaxID=4639 RepID=A0A426YBK6_ENSVE|nr:hypothetical protein B296_00051409 [Ensete ventricosum]